MESVTITPDDMRILLQLVETEIQVNNSEEMLVLYEKLLDICELV